MSDDTLTRILAELTALRVGQDQLQGEVTRLRTDMVAKFERIDDRLTQFHDEGAVHIGAIDSTHRRNERTREEVRDLADLQTRVLRLVHRLGGEVAELRRRVER